MNEKNLIRNLMIVIFVLVIIYSILRVGAGLDLSFGPYVESFTLFELEIKKIIILLVFND